jgi:hypothetical protein
LRAAKATKPRPALSYCIRSYCGLGFSQSVRSRRASIIYHEGAKCEVWSFLAPPPGLPAGGGTLELADAVITFLTARNNNPRRYVWKAKGEDILRKIDDHRNWDHEFESGSLHRSVGRTFATVGPPTEGNGSVPRGDIKAHRPRSFFQSSAGYFFGSNPGTQASY